MEQSIVYAFGDNTGTPIIPVDWFDDSYLKQIAEKKAPQNEEIESLIETYRESVFKDSFSILHGRSTQDLVRRIYEPGGLSRRRNKEICKNIKREVGRIENKRILIIFGLDHKFYIDDFLQNEDVEVLSALKLPQGFEVSQRLKNASINNIKASQALLEKRLAERFYRGEMKDRLEEKLKTYPKWLEAVSRL